MTVSCGITVEHRSAPDSGAQPGGHRLLTDVRCRNAKGREKPYKLAYAHGLHLYVLPSGTRSWPLKYRFGGKEHRLTFGTYLVTKLASRLLALTVVRPGVLRLCIRRGRIKDNLDVLKRRRRHQPFDPTGRDRHTEPFGARETVRLRHYSDESGHFEDRGKAHDLDHPVRCQCFPNR